MGTSNVQSEAAFKNFTINLLLNGWSGMNTISLWISYLQKIFNDEICLE